MKSKILKGALAGAILGCMGVEALEITPDTQIVLSEKAVPAEKTAADMLQKYLKKITGHKLKIVSTVAGDGNRILIGNDAASQVLKGIDMNRLEPDEVMYDTVDDKTLAIAGARPRGTLYAVYSLLENEFGVRFFTPDFEVVPQREKPVLENLYYHYAPPFRSREVHAEHVLKDHEYYTKLRLNSAMCREKIPVEFGGFHQMDMAHSLGNEFLSRQTWFKTHPEYFSWRRKSGKREDHQLCLSNPKVIDEIVKQALNVMEKGPERNFISIGNSDNGNLCECAECEKLYRQYKTKGAGAWIAANAVARAIRVKYPRARVMFQAYWTTERPPENLKLEPNIRVTLAMIDRNHGIPPSATARHDVYLRRYNELTKDNVFFWDYYADFTNFLIPTPNTDVIPHAMKTYRKFGLHGGFVQLPFGSLGDFVDYRTWLTSQLLWNPDQDAGKLKQEFFTHFYGSAAAQMLAYLDLLHTARDRKRIWISCFTEKTDHWLKPDDIFRINCLFAEALKATEKELPAHEHVRKAEAGVVLVNILRYRELSNLYAQKKIKFPDRESLIRKLEALGTEFKCGAYKEWDGFGNLIKRLREADISPAPVTASTPGQEEIISSKDLIGTHCRKEKECMVLYPEQEKNGYSWMSKDDGEIAYVIRKEQAGKRNVSLTLRSIPVEGRMDDAAYVGIYAPMEVCRLEVQGTAGDTGFRKIDLGEFELPEGSRIWVMPGICGLIERIEVREITLG